MVRKSKGTESHYHCENQRTAATDDYGNDHRQDRAACIGFMRTGQTDTIHDQPPHRCNQAAAAGDHLQNAC